MRIKSHKFGGYLSVVEGENGEMKPFFLKDHQIGENKTIDTRTEAKGSDSCLLLEETNVKLETDNEDQSAAEERIKLSNDDESSASNNEEDHTIAFANTTEDCTRWCLIKGDNDSVVLQSVKTGDNLGVDNFGNVVFHDEALWSIDCVTGELCFLSNQILDSRIRCDMAGLMTLSSNWKGWEVFRLMEAGHGYVNISSWMHSQWLLCSTSDGKVTACSHAEALSEDNAKGSCSKWAVEESADGIGVTIRSKSHERYLSINNGMLKTYHQKDETSNAQSEDTTFNKGEHAISGKDEASTDISTVTAELKTQFSAAIENTTDESKKNWWNDSLQRMQIEMKELRSSASTSMKELRTSASTSLRSLQTEINELQARAKKSTDQKTSAGEFSSQSQIGAVTPERETIIWNIEAAHLQTYYFSNITQGEKPRSIGPFPKVTPNLRKTEKLQLLRTEASTKLYNEVTKQYVACTSSGKIEYVDNFSDENTEWVMEKPPYQNGASVFRSRAHNLYLSYEDAIKQKAQENKLDDKEQDKLKLFKKDDDEPTLVGSETIGEREVWKLDPCMPRAVSSEKIKTFALGTSIAVGTTIALPFALAGMGALLGAVGAEVGIVANVIAVGLTGAEAIASVGAIGATAYIVFRPEDNSLTDNHEQGDEDEAERAWSKRPFSNWRNW